MYTGKIKIKYFVISLQKGKERRLQLISELRTRQKILNASEDMKTYQQFEGVLFGDQSLTEMTIENEELDTNKATTVMQEQLIADQTDSVRPAPTEEDVIKQKILCSYFL